MDSAEVAIVGAGLSGLACARELTQGGLTVTLLEASGAPGGRVRTDLVEGFRLDRGFQVLLTAYPETERVLNYNALRLKAFRPGALVWHGEKFHRFADPFREPLAALGFVFDPVITLADKLRVARLRQHVLSGDCAQLFDRPERTTSAFLQDFGFSDEIIARFFTPFFGGIFLERELVTSSRLFSFLFRMFSSGRVAVPELGMEEIPRQLAEDLPAGTLRTAARVEKISSSADGYRLAIRGAEALECRWLVIAVEEPQARLLLRSMSGGKTSSDRLAERLGGQRAWNRTTTFYYAAEHSPKGAGPLLMLNGEGRRAGPVNNVAVMSQVSRAYAPEGAELIAASVVGEAPDSEEAMLELEAQVRAHLAVWFPGESAKWRLLGAYPIEFALPLQRTACWECGAPTVTESNKAERAGRRVYVCGDYRETASIQGALASGRRAAEALLSASGRNHGVRKVSLR